MQRWLNKLIPFLILGIAIVAFAFGLMLLAYLLIFGAVVGFTLFAISWLRNKLFPPKTVIHRRAKEGRIIDTNDWRRM